MAKNGTIGDLLAELKKVAKLDDATIDEAKVYSVLNGKIAKELSLEYPVTSVAEYHGLFAERTPEDQKALEDGDRPILAFHFDKEPNKIHGVPFRFYLKMVCSFNHLWQF